jgi:hypothetical protein
MGVCVPVGEEKEKEKIPMGARNCMEITKFPVKFLQGFSDFLNAFLTE